MRNEPHAHYPSRPPPPPAPRLSEVTFPRLFNFSLNLCLIWVKKADFFSFYQCKSRVTACESCSISKVSFLFQNREKKLNLFCILQRCMEQRKRSRENEVTNNFIEKNKAFLFRRNSHRRRHGEIAGRRTVQRLRFGSFYLFLKNNKKCGLFYIYLTVQVRNEARTHCLPRAPPPPRQEEVFQGNLNTKYSICLV